MSFEITGQLHKVFETENKTETFQAREFVIKLEGPYPQFIKFQLTQDRCSIIDDFQPGEMIKVHFDLRGREWNEKYFTNLNAWKIEKDIPEVNDQPPNLGEESEMPGVSDFTSDLDEVDDLPF